MRHSDLIARENALTDALRAADEAIGISQPNRQALAIIAAIKKLRSGRDIFVTSADRIDYLSRVQASARANGSAIVSTPIGDLGCTTWRKSWRNGRLAWQSEYTLRGEPITIREIRDAGLAKRPTTRNRQKKEQTK